MANVETVQFQDRFIPQLISRGISKLRRKPKLSLFEVKSNSDLYNCANLFIESGAEKRGYFKNTPVEREWIMKEYQEHEKTVYAAKLGESLIGTLAVAQESTSDRSLPIDRFFPEAREHSRGGRAQITSFAIDQKCKKGKEAFEPLMSAAMIQVLTSGMRNLQITINPRHQRWYEKKLGFVPMVDGEVRMHPEILHAPMIGMTLRMDDAQKHPYIQAKLLKYALLLGT